MSNARDDLPDPLTPVTMMSLPIGNVTSITDPRNYVAEFKYDNNRRKTHTLHHDGGIAAPLVASLWIWYGLIDRLWIRQGLIGTEAPR